MIDGDAVIEWVGSGWILIRPAQPQDRATLPLIDGSKPNGKVVVPAPPRQAIKAR